MLSSAVSKKDTQMAFNIKFGDNSLNSKTSSTMSQLMVSYSVKLMVSYNMSQGRQYRDLLDTMMFYYTTAKE
jgi:hypothetical protein